MVIALPFGLRCGHTIVRMNGTRTRAWWLIRLELALGIAMTLLVGWLGFDAATEVRVGNPSAHPLPLPLPPHAMVFLGTLAIAIVGLVWMVRIIRGPGDDPPARWRYRDR